MTDNPTPLEVAMAAINDAISWFSDYAAQHYAKTPPDLTKALTNESRAAHLQTALSQIASLKAGEDTGGGKTAGYGRKTRRKLFGLLADMIERARDLPREADFDVADDLEKIDALYTAQPQTPPSGAGWNFDMEAAPRDGTRIDVWAAGRRFADVSWCGWKDQAPRWREPDDDDVPLWAIEQPVAWRHLPAPPHPGESTTERSEGV